MDVVLGQPSEQFLAGGLDEGPSGEAGVIGHLHHALSRRHEGPRFLVGSELGLGEHQTLKTAVEDVNAQGRD